MIYPQHTRAIPRGRHHGKVLGGYYTDVPFFPAALYYPMTFAFRAYVTKLPTLNTGQGIHSAVFTRPASAQTYWYPGVFIARFGGASTDKCIWEMGTSSAAQGVVQHQVQVDVPIGSWNNVVSVVSASNANELYANGTASTFGSGGSDFISSIGGPPDRLMFGGYTLNSTDAFSTDAEIVVTDAALYSCAFSVDDVNAHNAGVSPRKIHTESLVAYWSMSNGGAFELVEAGSMVGRSSWALYPKGVEVPMSPVPTAPYEVVQRRSRRVFLPGTVAAAEPLMAQACL